MLGIVLKKVGRRKSGFWCKPNKYGKKVANKAARRYKEAE